MFTKIVDFFSLMIFSTTTVVNDLPVKPFNFRNYPYGVIKKDYSDMDVVKNDLFDKPVYFLWDFSTFLQRWDVWFSVPVLADYFELHIRKFDSCDVGEGVQSAFTKNVYQHRISISLINHLSNKLNLAYRFNDKILSLGERKSASFSVSSLLDYYQQNNDLKSISFIHRFLLSFMEYDCLSGIAFKVPNGVGHIYLVPKWNNLSGINLRYFYFFKSNRIDVGVYDNFSVNLSLLSVDLKNRYIHNNMLIYPVITGSSYVNFIATRGYDIYDQLYVNLFSSGLSTSFSYNTIILDLPSFANSAQAGNTIRFMNFSMLDATTITGWNSEGNTKGWGMFDVVSSQSCVWYDVFCHITSAVSWVMNNVIGFKQLSKLVNLFFTPMSLTLKTFDQYNRWLGNLPLVSPVVVSGAMLLVLFNFYKRFK